MEKHGGKRAARCTSYNVPLEDTVPTQYYAVE